MPNADEYPRDFSIHSAVRSFMLRAQSEAERKSWVTAIQDTITDALRRKQVCRITRSEVSKIVILQLIIMSFQTFSSAVTQAVSGTDSASGSDTERLGEKAPIWVPDGRVTMCQECHTEFTLLTRRHHCRACGRVICGICSSCEAPLKWNDYKAARVCYTCLEELKKSKSSW